MDFGRKLLLWDSTTNVIVGYLNKKGKFTKKKEILSDINLINVHFL